MSYANYGPTFRSQTVSNLVGDINIAVPAGAPPFAETITPLIQTVGAAEIPLVLGEGTWAVQARAAMNPANGAATYQFIQCRLENIAGGVVASSFSVFGADVLDGHNMELYHLCTGIVTVAPGATLSLGYRAHVTANTAIVNFTGGYANITATKLSA